MIDVRSLSKSFRNFGALRDLSLHVPEGSAFVLVGANGAGKTTLIKILMNLLTATAGHAEVLGVDSRRLSPAEFRSIGYVSENEELPGRLTVRQYLDYIRPFYPDWEPRLEDEIRRQFQLPADRRINELSHGMRVKSALTCALPYRPKLLVLDEPFSGLDPLVRDELMEGLAGRAGETTILISSHELGEVEGFASHVAFLDEGKLLFQESMDTLTSRVQQIRVTVEKEPAIQGVLPAHWIGVREVGNVLTFVDTQFSEVDLQELVRARIHGIRRVEVQPMPLRTIFTSLARAARGRSN